MEELAEELFVREYRIFKSDVRFLASLLKNELGGRVVASVTLRWKKKFFLL